MLVHYEVAFAVWVYVYVGVVPGVEVLCLLGGRWCICALGLGGGVGNFCLWFIILSFLMIAYDNVFITLDFDKEFETCQDKETCARLSWEK